MHPARANQNCAWKEMALNGAQASPIIHVVEEFKLLEISKLEKYEDKKGKCEAKREGAGEGGAIIKRLTPCKGIGSQGA